MAGNDVEDDALGFDAWSRDQWPHKHVYPKEEDVPVPGTRRVKVVVDDYELAPSTKQELRRDFRRRTLDWLTKQRTDFQDHRPWLAFRRLLAEHDRHIRSGLQPAVIFMAAVKDWVQCCKSNMHHIQYACPHMSEFFDIMTADGEWPQEHLLQHWLTPLDDLVVDGHENVLTSNTSFSKHWNPGVEFDPANQQAHMVQTNPAGQHIFVAEEGDGELAVQTATWMEHLPVQGSSTQHQSAAVAAAQLSGNINQTWHGDPSVNFLAHIDHTVEPGAAETMTLIDMSGPEFDTLRQADVEGPADDHNAAHMPASAATPELLHGHLQPPQSVQSAPMEELPGAVQGVFPSAMQQAEQMQQEQAVRAQQAWQRQPAQQAQPAQPAQQAWQEQQAEGASALQQVPLERQMPRRPSRASDSGSSGRPLLTSPFSLPLPGSAQEPLRRVARGIPCPSPRLLVAESTPLEVQEPGNAPQLPLRYQSAPLTLNHEPQPAARPTASEEVLLRKVSSRNSSRNSSRSTVTQIRNDSASGELQRSAEVLKPVSPQQPPAGQQSKRNSDQRPPQGKGVTASGQSPQQAQSLDRSPPRHGTAGQQTRSAEAQQPGSSDQPMQTKQSNSVQRGVKDAVISTLQYAKDRAAAQSAPHDVFLQLELAHESIRRQRYGDARKHTNFAISLMKSTDSTAPLVTASQDGRASLPTLCVAVGLCVLGVGALVYLALHSKAILCLLTLACLILGSPFFR